MRYISPWSIHEAEIALYAAWKDGLPMSGPGTDRHQSTALFEALGSLAIEEEWEERPAGAFALATSVRHPERYSITVSFKDGLHGDDLGTIVSRMRGGTHVLTLRFVDDAGRGWWTKLQFFHVVPTGDERSASASGGEENAISRVLRLRAAHMQQQGGMTAMPALAPEVLGEVDWICGPQRVTGLRYSQATDTWSATSENSTGPSTPAYLSLVAGTGTHTFSYQKSSTASGAVTWVQTAAFTANSTTLVPASGFSLQTNGTAEPLESVAAERTLDQPVAVFRYLGRVYATVGHGKICVPKVATVPASATRLPRFCLGGLHLLPDGAYPITAPQS